MKEQSDTPRTDAAVKYGIVDVGDKWTGTNPLGMDVVDVETSRDLERALTTATRQLDEARAEVERLRSAFVHCHVRGSSGDLCAVCGLDLRDKVHTAATEAKP